VEEALRRMLAGKADPSLLIGEGETAEHAAKLVGIGKSYVYYAAIRRGKIRRSTLQACEFGLR
jgi:hypothetical protein